MALFPAGNGLGCPAIRAVRQQLENRDLAGGLEHARCGNHNGDQCNWQASSPVSINDSLVECINHNSDEGGDDNRGKDSSDAD